MVASSVNVSCEQGPRVRAKPQKSPTRQDETNRGSRKVAREGEYVATSGCTWEQALREVTQSLPRYQRPMNECLVWQRPIELPLSISDYHHERSSQDPIQVHRRLQATRQGRLQGPTHGLASVWVRCMRKGADSSGSKLFERLQRERTGGWRDLKAALRRCGLSCNVLNSLPVGQNGNYN